MTSTSEVMVGEHDDERCNDDSNWLIMMLRWLVVGP